MANRVYIKTWNDTIDDPNFTAQMNGGNGQMTMRLARSIFDYGASEDIILGYQVECWCHDKESPLGELVYFGIVTAYKPVVEDNNEYLEITLFSPLVGMSSALATDRSGNTKFTESADHGTIIRNLVDRYGGIVTTTDDSVDLTGDTLTYQFNTMTWLDAIKKVVELSPSGWYFYVDGNNVLHFHERNSNPDHVLTLGRHISHLEFSTSIEELKNHVVVIGGGDPPLFKEYELADSVEDYTRKTELVYDTNITTETNAAAVANKILLEKGTPTTDVKIEVIDSNGNGEYLGYDIESIKPGDTVQILGLGNTNLQSLWDVAVWDVSSWDYSLQDSASQVLQVTQVDYKGGDKVILSFSRRNYEVGGYLDFLNNKLQNYTNKDNPTAPS